MRVFVTEIGDHSVKTIGDAHLGRRFVNGVPLHRRGDRERMVMTQFRNELLYPGDASFVVQVGDIFDKFVVPLDIIVATADAIIEAAVKNDTVTYVFMRGNHDGSRDKDKVSAFQVLKMLLDGYENVLVVDDEPVVCEGLAFIPWSPWHTSREMVKKLPAGRYEAVFGHWDIEVFDGKDENVIPLEELDGLTNTVITGHDHKPRSFVWKDIVVTVTGSMQPYAHGEEPEDAPDPMYITVPLERLQNPCATVLWANKCVRILLNPGEKLPEIDFDCLQLTTKRVGQADDEEINVELGDFDMEALFKEAFQEEGVSDEVTAEFFGRFKELRAA